VDVAQIIVDWLATDDPFYLEERVAEMRLRIRQMEQSGQEMGKILVLFQQLDSMEKRLDVMR
jgi:hypothetical protein